MWYWKTTKFYVVPGRLPVALLGTTVLHPPRRDCEAILAFLRTQVH